MINQQIIIKNYKFKIFQIRIKLSDTMILSFRIFLKNYFYSPIPNIKLLSKNSITTRF